MKKIVKYIPVVLLAALMLLVCACKDATSDTYAQSPSASATATQLVVTGSSASATPTKPPILRTTPTADLNHITPTPTPMMHPSTPTATQMTRLPATSVPTSQPTRAPTVARPTPTPAPVHKGVNGNPWNYDFTPGNLIYSPPASFCSYFNCIASFWQGKGYVVECTDNTYSKSGGRSGSCSHHGGNKAILYAH
jgi:hypothetical protein